MSQPRPPALALRLLEARLGPEDAEAFIGDLLEEYRERAAFTPVRARLRFWREAVTGAVLLRSREHPSPFPAEAIMRSFLSDMRYGARLLRRAPGFALLCTATLALAIGATTVVFSVVNPVLLRSLPYPHPDRLFAVWERERDGSPSNVGWETYRDFAEHTSSVASIAVTGTWQPTLTEGEDAQRLEGGRVSWMYFRTLGVRPALGRDFTETDDVPANNHIIILSHGLWARRFGSDTDLVGATISLDGRPYTVAGVMPAGFEDVLSPTADLWRVLGYNASLSYACRSCRHLRMIARLRPGVEAGTANAEMDRVFHLMVAAHPDEYATTGVLMIDAQSWATKDLRPILYAVVGAVALLLLLAVANVTSLQLTRMMRREGEFAIRAALGAARGRVASQLLAEGTLVAALGGASGLAVALVALPLLKARLPEELPRLGAIHVDLAAAGVAAAITLLLALLVGLAPLWAWGRAPAAESMRSGVRLTGSRRRLARAALVVAEVAVAVTLLQGAGLLSRTLMDLLSVDVGFDPSHLVTMQVQSTGPRYAEDAAIYANHQRVVDAVGAVPGVDAAALASQLPLGGGFDRYGIQAQDKPLPNPELAPSADRYAVSGDFLATMRIPILKGRGFTHAELQDSVPHVVLVSASLARRIWPGEDPVGRHVRLGDPNGPWRTVVGVAGDIRHTGLDDAVTQQIYIPERQWFSESQWSSSRAPPATRPRSRRSSDRPFAPPIQPSRSSA